MNASNLFFDTNIFIRFLTKDNPDTYQETVKLFQTCKQHNLPIYLPGIVYAEISWVLSSHYKFPKPKLITYLQSILDIPNLQIIDNYHYPLALNYFNQHSIKYIDCLIATIPQLAKQKAVLITYDQDFQHLPIHTLTPAQYLSQISKP